MTSKLFSELGLSPALLKAIDRLGYEKAAPIQSEAIPLIMGGSDVVGQSQTGSGKTAAFGIPAVESVDSHLRAVQVIILCPTRELAVQVAEEIAYEARQDARAVFPYVPFVFWSNNGWVEAAGVLATELILEKRHNLALNTRNRLIYDHQLYYDLFELTVIVSREHGKVDLDDLVIPPENTNSILTTVPMPKEVEEQIDAEEAAKEQAKRKLFEKQEAEGCVATL